MEPRTSSSSITLPAIQSPKISHNNNNNNNSGLNSPSSSTHSTTSLPRSLSASGEYSVPPVIVSTYDEFPRVLQRPQSRSGPTDGTTAANPTTNTNTNANANPNPNANTTTDTGDQNVNVSFVNSFAILSELLYEGKLQPKQAERYKLKLTKLQQGIIKAHQIDQRLQLYAKKLKDEMDQQKEKLSKTGAASYEDNAVIANFRRDLMKAQTEAAMCHEREELERLEMTQLENRRKALQDDVELMRKKKEEELEPRIQSLNITTEEMKSEVQHQKTLIERMTSEVAETKARIEANALAKANLEEEANELRAKFSKIRSDPEKHRKQADVVQVAAKNLDEESEKLSMLLMECDRELSIQNKKKKEVVDESMELAIQLDRHRNNVEQRERTGDQILKDLELRKEEATNYLAIRAELELDSKGKDFTTRRKEELLIMKQREMNIALKQLRRAKVQLEYIQKSVPELQNLKVEMHRDVENQKLRARKQKEQLNDLRLDVDIVMSHFLQQEDLEKDVAEKLSKYHEEIRVLENELTRWASQEGHLLREASGLSMEREARSHDAAKAVQLLRDAKEELKMKDLIIHDLAKQQTESETRLHHYEKIYEHVKNERNKYMNLIQSIRLTDAELKEKIKILQNEIDILRTETVTKNKALLKVKAELQALCNERDQYRNEINKATYTQKKKQEVIEQQYAEGKKLETIINLTENEMHVLKKTYEYGVEDRNMTGLQLIDRNDELCILYEKSNIQESILRNGEIELRKKEEELRILKLHELEAQREINVARKFLPDIPKLENQIAQMQKELDEDRATAAKLAAQLESPDCKERWRKLEGSDPSAAELAARIENMQKKLDTKEEKLKEKTLVLEEITALTDQLRSQIHSSRDDTQQLAAKINDYKAKIKGTNRKMMAAVSELSIYKTKSFQLTKEISDTGDVLQSAGKKLARGEPPTKEAEEEWDKYVVRKAREQYERENAPLPPRVTEDGRFTMATRRHDHYVPEDGLGLPKPYTISAPFYPSVTGATMRHIRNPKSRDRADNM